MSLFHTNTVKLIGGLRGRAVRRVVGEEWEEMLSFSREDPEAITITAPPMDRMVYKSKSIPMVRIDAERDDILRARDSSLVSDHHILVLTWLIRREIYMARYPTNDVIDKFFDKGIRGSMGDLLKSGSWIDEPENHRVENLNQMLRKIDLGRRSHLNYTSNQVMWVDLSKKTKDKDSGRTDLTDPYADYEKAPTEARAQLRKAKPWMAAKWLELYGE